MRSNVITFLILLTIILAAGAYAWHAQQTETAENSEAARSLLGEEADTNTAPYTDLSGEPVDLQSFAGQVRVVNSWATWCPFCVEELADFQTLAAEIPDGEGVVIAINRSEPAAKQQSFIDRIGALSDILFLQDTTDRFYDSIGGFAMPETIFYRADGSVAVHKRGFMTIDEMRQHYETARTSTE